MGLPNAPPEKLSASRYLLEKRGGGEGGRSEERLRHVLLFEGKGFRCSSPLPPPKKDSCKNQRGIASLNACLQSWPHRSWLKEQIDWRGGPLPPKASFQDIILDADFISHDSLRLLEKLKCVCGCLVSASLRCLVTNRRVGAGDLPECPVGRQTTSLAS